MKRTDHKQPFKTVSYIGTSAAEMRPDGERPPRTARLVAFITWSWSPANSLDLRYLISTNRQRTGWILWAKGYDEVIGRICHSKVAWGFPFRGYSAKYAAEQLLITDWQSEKKLWNQDLRGAFVEQEGLLTRRDIKRIERKVFDKEAIPE
jgi:hypothetical protein